VRERERKLTEARVCETEIEWTQREREREEWEREATDIARYRYTEREEFAEG